MRRGRSSQQAVPPPEIYTRVLADLRVALRRAAQSQAHEQASDQDQMEAWFRSMLEGWIATITHEMESDGAGEDSGDDLRS